MEPKRETAEELRRRADRFGELLRGLVPFGGSESTERPDLASAEAWELEPGVEVGLMCDQVLPGHDGMRLIVACDGVDQAVLLDADDGPTAVALAQDGLLELAFPSFLSEVRLALGEREPMIVPVEQAIPGHLLQAGAPASPPAPLERALQAVELENFALAAERLGEWARGASGLLARVARALAATLRALVDAERAAAAAPGRIWTLFSYRALSGRLEVRAEEKGPAMPQSVALGALDPALDAALEASKRLGWHLARRHRQLPVDEDAGAVEIALCTQAPDPLLKEAMRTAGLAVALVAYSRERSLPVPPDLYVVGGLTADGRVEPIAPERLALLLGAASREHPGARVMIAQSTLEALRVRPDDLVLVGAESLAEAVQQAFPDASPEPAGDVAALLDEAAREERAYRHEAALTKARQALALPQASAAERLRARGLEGACLVHLGRPDEAAMTFAQAWKLTTELDARGELEHRDAVLLALGDADRLTDALDHAQALATLERARTLTAGAPGLRAKVDGFQGFVLIQASRDDEAVPLLERAARTVDRADSVRFRCWLVLALTALGRTADADLLLARTTADAEAHAGPTLLANRAYLGRARALLELRRLRPQAALEACDAALPVASSLGVYPRSSLLHARGVALAALGRTEEALATWFGARELPRQGAFLDLVAGLPELEAAAFLAAHVPSDPRTAPALQRARGLLEGYAPAARRFASALASWDGPWVAERLRSVLAALRY